MYHAVMRSADGHRLESKETTEELQALASGTRSKIVVCLDNQEKASKLLEKFKASKGGGE